MRVPTLRNRRRGDVNACATAGEANREEIRARAMQVLRSDAQTRHAHDVRDSRLKDGPHCGWWGPGYFFGSPWSTPQVLRQLRYAGGWAIRRSIRWRSSSRTDRNASSTLASEPDTSRGSGSLHVSRRRSSPGITQTSSLHSVTMVSTSPRGTCDTRFGRCGEMSIPSSCITRTAQG